MITGSSSAAQVLPGNPGEIARALETVGSGIAAARAVSEAWQSMAIPHWTGRAAAQWAAFTPRERGRTAKAPTALNRVSSAMMRYQSAFTAARAEIGAAISDAAAAERTTAAAMSEHREASRRAALADPGTAEATVAPFSDPGATALAAANTRARAAKTAFDRQGDEIASEVRAAAVMASGVRPTVLAPPGYNPDIDLARGAEFWKGFSLQTWDEIVALLRLAVPLADAPEQFAESLEFLTDPDAWHERQREKAELFEGGEIWHQLANALFGWDDWGEGSPESAGRVTVITLSWAIPLSKLGRMARVGRLGRPLSTATFDSRFEKLKSRAKLLNDNAKSGTTQYELTGGFEQAQRDFRRLSGGVVPRTSKKGTLYLSLPDGRTMNVRPLSSGESRPTFEVIDKARGTRVKFRYEE